MYGCENWTIKKAEHWRIDALELWCWRRLPRVPWTARRSNQLILKESNPEYSLEGLMLKLKLQYFGHPMQRTDSLEKIRMLGKIEGRRTRGWQRMRWLDGITDSMAISLSPFRETVKDRGAWHGAVHGVAKNWTRLKCLNNHNKAKEYYSPILDAWGWCTLSHASNLDWQSVSHMIIYMFQCHSLRLSHPCLLPQSPKDSSIHLCLFCCLAYRVIITIFLNSIYIH